MWLAPALLRTDSSSWTRPGSLTSCSCRSCHHWLSVRGLLRIFLILPEPSMSGGGPCGPFRAGANWHCPAGGYAQSISGAVPGLRDEWIMSPAACICPMVHTLTCANTASGATSRRKLAAYLSSSRAQSRRTEPAT
jgi:hypothetical protein